MSEENDNSRLGVCEDITSPEGLYQLAIALGQQSSWESRIPETRERQLQEVGRLRALLREGINLSGGLDSVNEYLRKTYPGHKLFSDLDIDWSFLE